MTAGDWILLFITWEAWWLCIYILADMARFALAEIEPPARYIGDKQEEKK